MNTPAQRPALSKRADSLGTENAFVVLAEVNQLVRAMKELRGRKAVVLATDGFSILQPDAVRPDGLFTLRPRVSQAIKQLVPDIIALQAVWYALDDMHELPADEQELGCLRAQWLIDRHENNIRTSWPKNEPIPASLEELITDAHASYKRACDRLSDGGSPGSC